MHNGQQVGELFKRLSKQVAGKIQPNPSKYIVMMAKEGAVDNETEMLSDMFGGYNAFG